MEDGGLTVIDGTQLRGADLRLPIPDGAVTGARLIEAAESEVAANLYGLTLPEAVRSAALRRLDGGGDGFLSEKLSDAESVKKKLQEYLDALADELQDDPLVISVLDGSALRLSLDDEDDFAMLAEDLFIRLDEHDKGKLSKKKLQSALILMGVEMGVPPFSESGDLLNNILQKHGAEGEEQLGQAQFAQLLQPILQDLADALAEKHVAVIQHIQVINGSKLKKILANEKLLEDVTERMFQGWEVTRSGEGNKETLRSFLEAKGLEFGLPPSRSHDSVALLYDQIFSVFDEEKITGNSRDEFQVVVKDAFEKFADHLEGTPVFIDLED